MNRQKLNFLLYFFISIFIPSFVSAANLEIHSDKNFDDFSQTTLIEKLCDFGNSHRACAQKRKYIRVLRPQAEQAFNDFVLFAQAIALAKSQGASLEKMDTLLKLTEQVFKDLLLKLGTLDIEDDESLRAKYLIATEPSFADAARKLGFDDFRDWYLREGYQKFLTRAETIRQTIIKEARTFPSSTNYNRYYAFERLYRITIEYSIIKDVIKLNPAIVENTRRQTAVEFSWFYMFSIMPIQ
jgi:hypothetical protein